MRKKIHLEHREFGIGVVVHKKTLSAGDALLLTFGERGNRTRRLVLVESESWRDPEAVQAALAAAPPEPPPKTAPQKPKRVRRADDVLPEPEISVVTEED